MKPTLQTVADAVGVSRSTVSNAYGRPDQLSDSLRERIFQVAREMGYPGPHPTARVLRRGRVGAVGVLFTAALSYAFADPYSVLFLRGLAEAAETHRSGLLLLPVAGEDEETAGSLVREAVVDGFCVYCVPESHHAMRAARARGLPVVSAERPETGAEHARWVGIDEAAATWAAAAHVAALGHRRVAVVATWPEPRPQSAPRLFATADDVPYHISRERLRGYLAGLGAAGVDPCRVTLVQATGNSRAAGVAAAALALDRDPQPTAVLAISDELALGVLDLLADRDLTAGVDVSVVGFDDLPAAARAGLTTVRQPAEEKGRIAGNLLLAPGSDPTPARVELPTELVVRASTGPAPDQRG
jgi:DNA-binding LacI/PurR family transcriptional regulator